MKKILIVEDNPSSLLLLKKVLMRHGFNVIATENAEAALHELHHGLMPDLIFTDLNMPGMNGIELIKNIRTIDGLSDTPVLLLTAETNTAIKEEARRCNAQGWLVKPFSPDALIGVINKFLT